MATNKKTVMHVYKLDTGNRPPEPHHNHLSTTTTTTKKIIVKSLGALLRRSKTYRENNHIHNHNHNINSTKEDTKEVVLETSRKSLPAIDGGRSVVPAIKDGRKSASVVEEGRKGAPGVEVGVVAGRRSAENRAEMVMINVAEVADLYQVRVLVTDMPAFMQVHAFRCARRTFDSLDETSPRQIACSMKKDFDKVYGPAWHCIVGSSFGSFVTHATVLIFGEVAKSRFNDQLSKLFDVYVTKYGSTSSHIHASMRNAAFGEGSSQMEDTDLYVYNQLYDESSQMHRGNTSSSELGRYGGSNFLQMMSSQRFKNFDLLAWWKSKEDQFPILATMARDLLTVQASTVASESAFSISGRVISIRRTRLTPKVVEMSICLKDYLDAAERVQDKRSLEKELDYEEEVYEDEVEAELTTPMTDEEAELDELLRNSSGSGSAEED